ncbi:SDR family NAD(P)-dependent oxidoreductase [Agromyces sp. SYSU T00266]|uniref:SDR family NAD(P)-dependent oxidoreductase n=1 Tax=Agromyces zhanjiangensis TaxID=3158562 RepID=UPI0033996425
MPATPPLAMIVGAGGAIGGAIAQRLAGDHRLVVIDRDPARLQQVASELPGDTLPIAVDASDASAIDEAFATAATLGDLTELAIAVGTTSAGSIDALETEAWRAVIDSNLTSVFQSLRAGVAAMSSTGGAICVIGSVHADAPQPGYPAYAAAKAGVKALVRQVAGEYGHHGIRVNLVTPGWTRAGHTSARLAPGDESRLLEASALRDVVEPADLAAAVAWLLSDAARRVTGTETVVDAGASLLGGATVLRPGYRQRLGLAPLD